MFAIKNAKQLYFSGDCGIHIEDQIAVDSTRNHFDGSHHMKGVTMNSDKKNFTSLVSLKNEGFNTI